MTEAFICDGVRTPIGRYGGALATVRTDDLAAMPLTALMDRNRHVDWAAIDDVVLGCANQAGEDNRNIARMALLLAGMPDQVPGVTLNRVCGSSLEAAAYAGRSIKSGEIKICVVGGIENMSRAPFVMAKADRAFSRDVEIQDSTLGWRFVNPRIKDRYGVDSLAETAENVAEEFQISRADQDAFALRSQQRVAKAIKAGLFEDEIIPVAVPNRGRDALIFDRDEHPRPDTTLERLAQLPTPFRANGTVTAGNASGINDGAAAMIVASEAAAKANGLEPRARILATAAAGVPPTWVSARPRRRASSRADRSRDRRRDLGIPDDAENVNGNEWRAPCGNGGQRTAAPLGSLTMCIGVGQGIAMARKGRLGDRINAYPPRIMGFGPAPATRKLLERTGLAIDEFDVIELHEAFASQALAVLRDLGIPDDAENVNPNGGAIALGHPLGMSGARLVVTAVNELRRRSARYALCTMCIGVGQGIAMAIERV